MPHPDDHDLTGQSAFNELVATVRSRRNERQNDAKYASTPTLCIYRGGWSKVNYIRADA